MDANEVIILSSDEENDCASRPKLKKNKLSQVSFTGSNKCAQSIGRSLYSVVSHRGQLPRSMQTQIRSNFYDLVERRRKRRRELITITERDDEKRFKNVKSPEIVDLEEFNNASEKPENKSEVEPDSQNSADEIQSDIKIIESNDNEVMMCSSDNEKNVESKDVESLPDDNLQINAIDSSGLSHFDDKSVPNGDTPDVIICEPKTKVSGSKNDLEIPEFFNNFVEVCSSLEEDKNDKARLIKKLNKRCLGADPNYVQSEEFRMLIEKSKGKINANNMYLIAKEITDELSLRKKIDVTRKENNHEDGRKDELILEHKDKKKTRLINKIIKRLDKLGLKIRELEEVEVDLSDEEDSSYVLLQRYRERFCQIYKKLCEVMNEPADANRVYSRKICFSGSKYPEINKCIENFLNKTKRFPDFNDIVKLLESQSSSLGLPSNRESIRATATEIFQQVGVMLQRRRKYDLWDSFCGFLNDDKDPALDDPELDKILKENFDTRVKKEQDIFRYYAEKQEKERLEPEEVPEEEANLSPVESGNEDEKEIEEIENSLNERVDVTIDNEQNLDETKENDESFGVEDWDEEYNNPTEVESFSGANHPSPKGSSGSSASVETLAVVKETKNNYKNCKSIKWRNENRSKSMENSESCKKNVEEKSEKEKDNKIDEDLNKKTETKGGEDVSSKGEGTVTEHKDSDVECIGVEPNPEGTVTGKEDIDVECIGVDEPNPEGTVTEKKDSDVECIGVELNGKANKGPNDTSVDASSSQSNNEISNKSPQSIILEAKVNEDNSSSEKSSKETSDIEKDKKTDEDLNGKTETKEPEEEMDVSPKEGEVVTDKKEPDIDDPHAGLKKTESDNLEVDSSKAVVQVLQLPVKIQDLCSNLESVEPESAATRDSPSPKKRRTDPQLVSKDLENDYEGVFEVHVCQVEHDYVDDGLNLSEDLSEKRKNWGKGKVFKDLTNIKRLMELNSRGKKSSGLFSHPIYHRGFSEFSKFSWKKRFRLNYKFVGLKDQKCALNQDDKEGKSVGGDGKDSEEKKENNSESGGDEGSNFFSGFGSGSEKDNDENDENKKSERKDEPDDKKREEEDEDDEETEDEMSGKDGPNNENETSFEDVFNCSTEDQASSLNDTNTTLEYVLDQTGSNEREEGMEVSSTSEIENKTKIGENLGEIKANEPEETAFGGSELESQINSKKDKKGPFDGSYKTSEDAKSESQKQEKLRRQYYGHNTKECHGKNKSNEAGETEKGNVKEKEQDAETGEQQANEDEKGKKNEETKEGGEGNSQNKESVEQEEEAKKEKPLIRLRNLAEIEAKVKPRMRPWVGPRMEPWVEQRMEGRVQPRMDPWINLRLQPRMETRVHPNIEARIETRMQLKVERSPLGCRNKRENVSKRERGEAVVEREVATPAPAPAPSPAPTNPRNQDSEVEFIGQKIGKQKKTTKTPSDEERVKKFLMHSPSSISIIPPKKLSLSKPPSQAALQALETLKGLKDISATRVKAKEEDDVVVIGESYSRPQTARKSTGGAKRRRSELPVISSVHSIQPTPKILAVQGNVHGFRGLTPATANSRMKNGQPEKTNESSSIRISSVWGSVHPRTGYVRGNAIQGMTESSPVPGCSFEQNPGPDAKKKKKKPVEFVVLD